MRRNPTLILAIVGVLVAAIGNAQEFHKEIDKSVSRHVRLDVTGTIAKSVVAELTKDKEFREQIAQQVVREIIAEIGPGIVGDTAKSVADEVSNAHGVKMRFDSSAPAHPDTYSITAVPVSVAGQFARHPAEMNALQSAGNANRQQARIRILRDRMVGSGTMRMRSNQEGATAPRSFPSDLIAVITHPLNPVDTLAIDQVRKLLTGEYTNWSQVGGEDLPVRLITSMEAPDVLESLLDTRLAPSAATVPFISFLFVGVTENRGAVGFLLTDNMQQIYQVRRHGAIKRISIKKDKYSPS